MELKSLISEYFTSGVLLLVSICLTVVCIAHNDIVIVSLFHTIIELPTPILLAFGLVLVIFATSLGASNNAISMFLFNSIESRIRRQVLEQFLEKPSYFPLPILRSITSAGGGISGKIAKDTFSSIRAYLYKQSTEVSRNINFHRNDIRFCRGLIIPHAILSITVPCSIYLLTLNVHLATFLGVVIFLSTVGIIRAYKSRLKWMQEYSLRTYLHSAPSDISDDIHGLCFVLIGSSGVGKTKLTRALLKRCKNLRYIPKCTTRHPRHKEQYCIDYRFLSAQDFMRLEKKGSIIAHKKSEFDDSCYGILKEDLVGKTDIILNSHSLKGLDILKTDLIRFGFNRIIAIHVSTDLSYAKERLPQTDSNRIARFSIEKHLSNELFNADNQAVQYSVENSDCQLSAFDAIWEIIKFERSQDGVAHCHTYDRKKVSMCQRK